MRWTDLITQQFEKLVDAQLGEELAERIKQLPTAQNEFGYDPFGFNRDELKPAIVLTQFLYRNYFRVEAHNVDRVPAGRALLVSNHSGQLPFDAVCIGGALILERNPPRMVRAMVDKFVQTLPFVSYIFSRWGQINGTPENCKLLLDSDEAILVFPEGARGISKSITQKYQLQPFGLGFMRLALQTKTPIVPVAVIGAEEQAPAFNVKPLAKLIGAPSFPISPLPPFFPIVPYPTKYRLYFGEPMHFEGDPDDEDDVLAEKVKRVSNEIQNMLRIGLKDRKHIFW